MMWDRQQLINNLHRPLRYAVVQPKTISPLKNIKKWDWVSQQILLIGDYYFAWDWLIEHEKDADTVLTGRKGNGKTTTCLRIALDKSRQKQAPFNVKNNVHIGRNIHLVAELIGDDYPEHSVLVLDEMQHYIHKMRPTSTANVEANKFMDTKRKIKLNVIGTMPHITSVDKDMVNEKIVFWINCWKSDEVKRQVHTVIWVNLTSKDGKFRDFVRFQEKIFRWAPTPLYLKATAKWHKKIHGIENLEDYQKSLMRQIEIKRRRERNRQMREIIAYDFLTIDEKCCLLLDMEFQKIKIQKYLKKGKDFVYGCEAEMDLDPELIERIQGKVLQALEPREK
ncbi:MAG: hypothetical protein ACFFCI_00725 [Promethearchaeota archaeon]